MILLCLWSMRRSSSILYVSAFQMSRSRRASPFLSPSNVSSSKSVRFLYGGIEKERSSPARNCPLFTRHAANSAPSPPASKSTGSHQESIQNILGVTKNSCVKYGNFRVWPHFLSSVSSGEDLQQNNNGLVALIRRLLLWPLVRLYVCHHREDMVGCVVS